MHLRSPPHPTLPPQWSLLSHKPCLPLSIETGLQGPTNEWRSLTSTPTFPLGHIRLSCLHCRDLSALQWRCWPVLTEVLVICTHQPPRWRGACTHQTLPEGSVELYDYPSDSFYCFALRHSSLLIFVLSLLPLLDLQWDLRLPHNSRFCSYSPQEILPIPMVLTAWWCCLVLPSSQAPPPQASHPHNLQPRRHLPTATPTKVLQAFQTALTISQSMCPLLIACFVNDLRRWDPGNFLRLPLKCKEFIMYDLCLSSTLPKPLLHVYSHTHNPTSHQSRKSTNLPRLFLCQVLCILSLKRWVWSVPSVSSKQPLL